MRIIFLIVCLSVSTSIYSQSNFFEINLQPGINIYTSAYNTIEYPLVAEHRGDFSIRKNTGTNLNFSALFSATTALKLGFGLELNRIAAYNVWGPTVNVKVEFPVSLKVTPFIEGAVGLMNRKTGSNYDNGLMVYAKAGAAYKVIGKFFKYLDHLSINASGGFKFFNYGYSHPYDLSTYNYGDGLIYRENFKVIVFNLGASIGF